MGGIFSGRKPWGRKRREVEECVVVDLYGLIRSGLVRPGEVNAGPALFKGPRGFGVYGSVWSDLYEDLVVELHCRHPEDSSESSTTVRCQSTPQPFDGKRWWFVCPEEGTLVPKLYLPPGTGRFASRRAHGLGYRCERLPDLERLYQRKGKLELRLGRIPRRDVISEATLRPPPRPRGMRVKRYLELAHRFNTLIEAIWRPPSSFR